MSKKRILIVSGSFYPENFPRSFRTTELAKEFVRSGHDVTVLLPDKNYDHSGFLKTYSLNIRYIGRNSFPRIEGPYTGLYGKLKRALSRLLLLLFEYPSIELMPKVKNALNKEHGYDLLISIAVPYPIHWGVAWARSGRNKIATTWVADCGDPYMGCETDSFKKLFYFKYLEKWFSRKCDFISIPFSAMMNKFYPEFKDKIVVIPQGFRLEDIILADKVKNEVPTFAFSGSIIPGIRDLTMFFEVLKEIKKDFKFYVYTKQFDYFKPFKAHFGDSLELCDYLPRLQLIYELSKCDFLVNIDTIFDCKSLSTAFPSKLIDYALTLRPILNFCSNSIDKSDLTEFFGGNYSKRRLINYKDYDIEIVTNSFLTLIAKNHP